jgi:Legume lectin domain/YDG domain
VNDGNGGKNYTVTFVNIGSGVITQAPLNIAAATNTKPYDTTPSAAATPVPTGLKGTDSVTGLVETYNTSSVGMGLLLGVLPGYTVNDGNGGNNYAVTTTPNGTGVISPAPLTATIPATTRNFDGTTAVTLGICSLSGVLAVDNVSCSASGAMLTSPGPGPAVPVTATVTLSGSASGNYMLTSYTSTAVINDTITLSSLSLNGTNYGSSTPATPAMMGSMLQLTNTTTETVSAWLGAAVPVSSAFTTTFQFQISPGSTGPNSIGDGFAFVIQGAPTGTMTLGSLGMGGYIGYAGIPNSIAIEFDTYENPQFDDPSNTHIAIQSLGSQPNTPDHTPVTMANLGGTPLANFADGNPHFATITYDGNLTLSVYFDGSNTPIATGILPSNLNTFLALNGSPAYIGFTAATGSAQENSDILSWTWDFPNGN